MNNRYDGTNGNGYQPLPLHGDDNPKAPPRCAKPEEAEGVERQRMIESMCLTWRHDFGLDAPAPGSLASGMTESGRQHLRGEMGKLFDHHFAPVLSAVTAERDGLVAARTAYASEFAPDKNGDPDVGSVHANIRALKAERDQLRAEVEASGWIPLTKATPPDGVPVLRWPGWAAEFSIDEWCSDYRCFLMSIESGERATHWKPLCAPKAAMSAKEA